MLSKNQIKYYSSLLQKKQRHSERKFIVEGPKLLMEALHSNFQCEIVILTNSYDEKYSDVVKEVGHFNTRIELVKKIDFDKMIDTKNPQEIIGIFLEKKLSANFEEEDIIIALETVNDPGNLGTILRNCDWFGIKTIIINSECAEVMNPKVIRSSAGSVFHLNIVVEDDFLDRLNELKDAGYKLLCADIHGENIFTYKKENKSILILANESNGPSQELLNICDKIISIPLKGNAESLNVASASAVILALLTK